MVCYRTHDKWSEKETRPHHSEPEPEQTTEKTKYKREQKVKTSSIKFHGFARGWEVTKELAESSAGLKGQSE
eukprot:3772560-Pyramimonas_sp.AAC.1